MPALLVHSLVAVAEKRKALCVSKGAAYFCYAAWEHAARQRGACWVCAARWGSNWGWPGYIEKGNGENVMSCFSLKPPGKGEKQRKKKSTFKKIRDPTGK